MTTPDLGRVQVFARSAQQLLEAARAALEAGNRDEASTLIDLAELQIDAMIDAMPAQQQLPGAFAGPRLRQRGDDDV